MDKIPLLQKWGAVSQDTERKVWIHFHHTFSVSDSHMSSSRTSLWELKLFRSWTVTLSELCLPPGSYTSSSPLCTGPDTWFLT